MAQGSHSSGSTPKPNYNKHFPRSFLLNYGEALQDLPDDKILARLKHWNCEWLSRPNIAMSEMAATLKDNWEQITRLKGTVFTTSFVNQLETFSRPIMPALRRLDNKDRYCHDPPDKDDILIFMVQNPQLFQEPRKMSPKNNSFVLLLWRNTMKTWEE